MKNTGRNVFLFGFLACLLLFVFLSTACRSNWAERNDIFAGMGEVVNSLNESCGEPVELSQTQIKKLEFCLKGPVRQNFIGTSYAPEVRVGWGKVVNGSVVFIRSAKDESRFTYVSFNPEGLLSGAGGGFGNGFDGPNSPVLGTKKGLSINDLRANEAP